MVKVNPVSSTVEKIEQSLYFVEKGNKLALLIHLLKHLQVANALVFSRTKHGADKIVKQLEKAGITAAAIHGNKGQNARVTALENFKAGKTQVLVATDIAARGIDINELSHVFNFDLPEVPETYVHRIGRTARAGADGVAISFCASEEKEYLQGIEKLNRKRIPVVEAHPWAGKPSPVKALVNAPVRGRKPVVAEPTRNNAEHGRGQKPTRQSDKGMGAMPASRRKEEHQMQDKDKRNANAPKAGQNTQQGGNRNNRNSRSGGNRGAAGKPTSGANSAKPRPAAPAQPKFDPRFLTPQAAEQVPHAAPAAPRAPEPQMLDVRRMNQANAPRGEQGNPRSNSRGNRNVRNNNNRNQNTPQGNAPQSRTPQGGTAQGRAPQGSAAQSRAPQGGVAQTRTPQGNRNAPQGRNPRNDRANQRNDRNDRNDRGGSYQPERNPNAPRSVGGKINQSGLQTVRSNKPIRSNDKDPGLVLITKKPPQQKFTDFDAYMAAHGGVTAPVDEYGDK